MNLKSYLERLQNSELFKKFKTQNPNSFLCSCFFVIDKQGTDNRKHFDFFLPEKKKIFSFQLENMQFLPLETPIKNVPEKLLPIDVNFDEIERMIIKEMEKNNIKNKIQKIFLSLQRNSGRDFLICTVFISRLGLLRVNIDLLEKKIILFEKKSFFDMLKRIRKDEIL